MSFDWFSGFSVHRNNLQLMSALGSLYKKVDCIWTAIICPLHYCAFTPDHDHTKWCTSFMTLPCSHWFLTKTLRHPFPAPLLWLYCAHPDLIIFPMQPHRVHQDPTSYYTHTALIYTKTLLVTTLTLHSSWLYYDSTTTSLHPPGHDEHNVVVLSMWMQHFENWSRQEI